MATSTAQSNSPDFASTLQFYSSSAAPPVLSNQDKMVNLGKRAGNTRSGPWEGPCGLIQRYKATSSWSCIDRENGTTVGEVFALE